MKFIAKPFALAQWKDYSLVFLSLSIGFVLLVIWQCVGSSKCPLDRRHLFTLFEWLKFNMFLNEIGNWFLNVFYINAELKVLRVSFLVTKTHVWLISISKNWDTSLPNSNSSTICFLSNTELWCWLLSFNWTWIVCS